MSFRDDVVRVMESREISVALNQTPAAGEDWQSLVFRRGDETAVLPCRADLTADTPQPDMMLAALLAAQIFHECDDVLEWSEIYELDPGDNTVWNEFREFDAACWRFRALLGEDLYQDLMTGMAIGQAIGAAAASFSRHNGGE